MQPEWRITDGDRHSAARALGEHYAAGRLDAAEFDERAERAYAARTNEDLRPLFVDLPEPHGPMTTTPPPAAAVPARRDPSYRRPGPRGFGFPLLPVLVVVLVVGLHFFWLFPLVFIAFWVLRGGRHWHPGHARRW